MLVQVSTDHLGIGMYVSKLDRPWTETPYMFQGFFIKEKADIDEVKKYSKFVFVDDVKGAAPTVVMKSSPESEKLPENGPGLPERKAVYQDTSTIEEEMEVAKECHENLSLEINDMMDDIRNGRQINLEKAKVTIDGMVESILRNPDAFMWLTKLKEADAYSYSHAIDSSVLAISFGRHLGLSKPELQDLAMGGLMFDVGKMKIAPEILEKEDSLTDDEFEEIKKHVQYTVEIMEKTEGASQEAIEIARHHHERHDGSGYPLGLEGEQIPVFSRMVAIVDCFDAISSDRTYGKIVSPHSAIKKLYEWGGKDFQEELVEQFIQCLGVYPTGSLVELSTGEVGVVLSQNRMRRLRPKIMLILDPDKEYYSIFPTIDLMMQAEDDAGNAIEIVECPEPGAYGIDPKAFYL